MTETDPRDATTARTCAKLCKEGIELRPEIQEVATKMMRKWRGPLAIVRGRRVCQRDHFGLFIYGTWGVSCDVMLHEGDPRALAERDIRYEIQMAWVMALNSVLAPDVQVTCDDIYIYINRHTARHTELYLTPPEPVDGYVARQLAIDQQIPRDAAHYRTEWWHLDNVAGRSTITAGDAGILTRTATPQYGDWGTAADHVEHVYQPDAHIEWAAQGTTGPINGLGVLRGATAGGWIVELAALDAERHPDCLVKSRFCVMPTTAFRPRS